MTQNVGSIQKSSSKAEQAVQVHLPSLRKVAGFSTSPQTAVFQIPLLRTPCNTLSPKQPTPSFLRHSLSTASASAILLAVLSTNFPFLSFSHHSRLRDLRVSYLLRYTGRGALISTCWAYAGDRAFEAFVFLCMSAPFSAHHILHTSIRIS